MSLLADADWVTHSLRVGYLRYVDDHYARQVIEFPYDGSDGFDLSTGEAIDGPGLGGLADPYMNAAPEHRQTYANDAGAAMTSAPAAPASIQGSRVTASHPDPSTETAVPPSQEPGSLPSRARLRPPKSAARSHAATPSVTVSQPSDAPPSEVSEPTSSRIPSAPESSVPAEPLQATAGVPSPQSAGTAGLFDTEAEVSLSFAKLSPAEVQARSKFKRPAVSAIAATLKAQSAAALNPFAALYQNVCDRTAAPPTPAPAAPSIALPPGVRIRHAAGGALRHTRTVGPGRNRGRPGAGPGQGGAQANGPSRIEVYFPFADKKANAAQTEAAPAANESGPVALNARKGSMTLSVRRTAKMEEVIGYALYCYTDAQWLPELAELANLGAGDPHEIKLTTLGYCLRIVEDGDIDDDFAPLDLSLQIGNFGGDEFAVCQASANQIKENETNAGLFRAARKAALLSSLKALANMRGELPAGVLNRSSALVHLAEQSTRSTGLPAAHLSIPGSENTAMMPQSALRLPGAVSSGANASLASSTTAGQSGTIAANGGLQASHVPSQLSASAADSRSYAALNTAGGGPAVSRTVGGGPPATNVTASSGSSSIAAAGSGGHNNNNNLEATVFLRVSHMLRVNQALPPEEDPHPVKMQEVSHKTMIQVPAQMYFADVLDLICRKLREERPGEWALVAHYAGDDIVVPLNRTVESLDEACDLKLVRRDSLTVRGAMGRLTAPGGNPNTSIFAAFKKSKNDEPLAGALDLSAYKSWKVIRATRSARMFSKPERLLTLDGEWIWIEPSDTRHFSARPTSFHFSSVVACKQATKGGPAFKLVVRRMPSLVDTASAMPAAGAAAAGRETKRYDLEAENADEAEEIVREVNRVMARRKESGNNELGA